MLLLASLGVIMIAVVVRLALPVAHRLRVRAQLRRDWWPAFEREFRAYASAAWEAARDAERSS